MGKMERRKRAQLNSPSMEHPKKRRRVTTTPARLKNDLYLHLHRVDSAKSLRNSSSSVHSSPLKEHNIRTTRTSNVQLNKNLKEEQEALTCAQITTEVKTEKADIKSLPEFRSENLKEEPEDTTDVQISTEVKTEKAAIKSLPDLDGSDDEVDYLRLRESNIAANQAFLAQIGMLQTKASFSAASFKTKLKTKSYKERSVPREREVLPRRSSLRLQRIAPDGNPLPDMPDPPKPLDEHPSVPEGPLEVESVMKGEKDTLSALCSLLNDTAKAKVVVVPSTGNVTQDKCVKEIAKLRISEEHVAKVVPHRIFSAAVHPSLTKTLVAIGDKWGGLGLWDVDGGDNSIHLLAPHSRPISHLVFPSDDPCHLISSSYDGTLRSLDLERNIFDEISQAPDNLLYHYFDYLGPQTLVVAQNNGNVVVIDLRTPSGKPDKEMMCHNRSAKCVSVHPVQKDYFITCSLDRSVCVYDIRNAKKTSCNYLSSHSHGKSVCCAVFSPITGNKFVTLDFDDKLKMYDSTSLHKCKVSSQIRHNNNTGRWLSPLRAVWHPRNDDLFFTGIVNYPRQIQLYDSQLTLRHQLCGEVLSSICSRLAVHPTRNVVVGGNSSGKTFVFKS